VIRILIADDFESWRAEVRRLLRKRSDWQIVGEVSDGLLAIQKVVELRPDLILLDLAMPNLDGLQACGRILNSFPAANVIFLSQNTNSEVVSAALATGAKGYVLKANAFTELIPAIERCFT
jgi:DNA-binding NarL/FixJ family response regulator